MREITLQEWESFLKRMKPLAIRRLAHLRRADGDCDDAFNSVWRTYHERAKTNADKERLESDYDGDVLKLLEYHLFRKIRRANRQEKTLCRSAKRSADVVAPNDCVFWNWFSSDELPEDRNIDLFLDRLLEPLDGIDPLVRNVAELRIAGFKWYEIYELTGFKKTKVDKARVILKGLLAKYRVGL